MKAFTESEEQEKPPDIKLINFKIKYITPKEPIILSLTLLF